MHIPESSLARALATILGDLSRDNDPAESQDHAPVVSAPIADLAGLIERLRADPAIVAATPPGVTRSRLAAILPPSERRLAAPLLEWFDSAAILTQPRSESLRRREPRTLIDEPAPAIMARLRAVPFDAGDLSDR